MPRLGLGLGLSKLNNAFLNLLPCKGRAVQWIERFVEGIGVDKIGTSGSEVNRPNINGRYIEGNGTIELLFPDLPSTAFTYIDHTTGLEVSDTTDGSGLWLVPTNGVDLLTIDGDTFPWENGQEDIRQMGQLGIHYCIIQNATGADIVETTAVPSRMDDTGLSTAIRNEVDNYDFSDGTIGWTVFNATTSVTNKELAFTAASQYGRVFQILTDVIDGGDTVFIFAKVKSSSEFVRLALQNDVSWNWTSHSGSGEYEDLYNIVTEPAGSGFEQLIIRDDSGGNLSEVCVDGDISNGGGVFALNLTKIDEALGTSYATMTAEEVNAIKYDLLALQRWYEPTLENIVPTGKRSYTLNGKAINFYDSTGEHPTADFTGALKANLRVVDGVVDNGVDYENWEVISGDIDINQNSITYTGGSVTTRARNIELLNIKDSTAYTIVIDILNTTVLNGLKFTFSLKGVLSSIDVSNTGEKRILINVTTGGLDRLDAYLRDSAGTGENCEIKIVGIYEGDYVTGEPPLPTSGEPVSGNSLINDTTYYPVVQADKLTTVQMFNHDNPDAVYPVFVAVDDFLNIDNDTRYTIKDETGKITEQYLYDGPLEEPCYTKANKYGDLVEALLDSEGSPLVDSEGDPLYALKDTTTREVL